MLDFKSLSEAWRILKTMSPEEQGHAQTMFVWACIAYCVYYVVVGTVAIVLGRRMIQAVFAAFKEARRERP